MPSQPSHQADRPPNGELPTDVAEAVSEDHREPPISIETSGQDSQRHPVESLASQWLDRARQAGNDPRVAGRTLVDSSNDSPQTSPRPATAGNTADSNTTDGHLQDDTDVGDNPKLASQGDSVSELIGVGDEIELQGADAKAAEELKSLLPVIKRLESARRTHQQKPAGLATLGSSRPERLGDFRIIRQIGRGGMGVVFEAEQVSLGRTVAIKVLPQAMLQEDRQIERFRVEAQLAASLHHTNIVPVFGFGEDCGYHFYVMQRINGSGLDHIRLTGEPLSIPLVVQIGIQAASALHYAHEQGVLHRDIKPANLLLDQDQKLWITDFGVAKAIESVGQTRTNDVVGTLRYMAPEHFLGAPSSRSDVYSLGLTLYELLAGRPAVQDESIRAAMVRHTPIAPPAPIRKINRNVSKDLETILRKAIASDERDRYQTAAELAEDLERFREGQPILARRHSFLETTWRIAKRRPAVAALATLSAILLLSVALTASIGYYQVQRSLGEVMASRQMAERTSNLASGAMDKLFERFAGDDLLEEPNRNLSTQAIASKTFSLPVVRAETAALMQELLDYYEDIARTQSNYFRSEGNEDQAKQKLNDCLRTLVATRLHIGSIYSRFGQYEDAANAFEKAIAEFRSLKIRSGQTPSADSVSREADLLSRLGWARQQQQDFTRADRSYSLALRTIDSAPIEIQGSPECQFVRARIYFRRGIQRWPDSTSVSFPPMKAMSFGRYRKFNDEPLLRPMRPLPRDPMKELMRLIESVDDESGEDRSGYETTDLTEHASNDSVTQLSRAVEMLEKLTDQHADRPAYALQLAIVLRHQAVYHGLKNKAKDHLAGERAIEILEDLNEKLPEHPQIRLELIKALTNANVFRFRPPDRSKERLERLTRASGLIAELVDQFPGVLDYRFQRSLVEFQRGVLLQRSGEGLIKHQREQIDYQTSLAFRTAIDSIDSVVRRSPEDWQYRAWQATFQMWLGDALGRMGEINEAIVQLSASVQSWKAVAENRSMPTTAMGLDRAEEALVDLLHVEF